MTIFILKETTITIFNIWKAQFTQNTNETLQIDSHSFRIWNGKGIKAEQISANHNTQNKQARNKHDYMIILN